MILFRVNRQIPGLAAGAVGHSFHSGRARNQRYSICSKIFWLSFFGRESSSKSDTPSTIPLSSLLIPHKFKPNRDRMDAFLTSPPSAGSKRKSDTLSTAEKVPAATKVPSDLSQLSRDDLISMLKSVAAERDALTSSKKSAKKAASSSSSSSASASASSSSAAVDVAGIKKRLCAKAVKAIKKTKHNDKKKPYTEVKAPSYLHIDS